MAISHRDMRAYHRAHTELRRAVEDRGDADHVAALAEWLEAQPVMPKDDAFQFASSARAISEHGVPYGTIPLVFAYAWDRFSRARQSRWCGND